MITEDQMGKLHRMTDQERRHVLADIRRLLGIRTLAGEPDAPFHDPITITLDDFTSGDTTITSTYATRQCKDKDIPDILRCCPPDVTVTQVRGYVSPRAPGRQRTINSDALLREYAAGYGAWCW